MRILRSVAIFAIVFAVALIADLSFAASSSSSSASSVSSRSSSSVNDVHVSLTDGRDRIHSGGDLVYVVTLRQNTSVSKAVDVTLTLPAQSNLISPNNGGQLIGNIVRWNDVTLAQNTDKTLTVSVSLVPNIPENTQLFATASVDGKQVTDATVVQSSAPVTGQYYVDISDGKTEVKPGDTLSYVIRVKNLSDTKLTKTVEATMPSEVSILTSVPEGEASFPRIVWSSQMLEPNTEYVYTVDVQVQKRITNYVQLKASAKIEGVNAVDTTIVNAGAVSSARSSKQSSAKSSASSVVSQAQRSVLFRKVADSSETVPGGRIRYTLYVQNVLLTTIRDAKITDRFDPATLTVIDAGGATSVSDRELQWNLPRLDPGETWRQSYVLAVSEQVPDGTSVSNIATISGDDVKTATLEEKVGVVKTGVVPQLPTTGAASDVLFAIGLLPVSALFAFAQRRRSRR